MWLRPSPSALSHRMGEGEGSSDAPDCAQTLVALNSEVRRMACSSGFLIYIKRSFLDGLGRRSHDAIEPGRLGRGMAVGLGRPVINPSNDAAGAGDGACSGAPALTQG